MVTTDSVKKLRDKTGVSVMQCKHALEEAKGDMEKAVVILHKKSGVIVARKADRALGSGVVQAYIHNNNSIGAVVVLGCETDFVAKNRDFIKLAYNIAMHITATNPEFTTRADVSEKAFRVVKEVFAREVTDLPAATTAQAGKPKDMRERILEGKLDAYFKEKILMEQSFIKDPDKTIGALINEAVQKFGERIEIISHALFKV